MESFIFGNPKKIANESIALDEEPCVAEMCCRFIAVSKDNNT